MPMLIQDYLDVCDPVLTFDRFMGEIELEKYLKNIPQHDTGRLRYDPVSMLKTVLFGFMANQLHYSSVLSIMEIYCNFLEKDETHENSRLDSIVFSANDSI
uniref:hypothetical protein n=1 Tax=Coprococcus comes TaxID=410072 RepID=UPI001FAE436F|nr:hypothetical protein [Coprococcus comes]